MMKSPVNWPSRKIPTYKTMVSELLEFESDPFLHSLFDDDPSLLRDMEAALGVRATARGGMLKLQGEAEAVSRGMRLFEHLESIRRQSGTIDRHRFQMAVKAMSETGHEGPALRGDMEISLLGGGNKPPVRARTVRQAEYLRCLEENPVVFGLGPAGTGKTYLAVAKALDAIKSGRFLRLILSRPAVEAGEALGFLPGDMKEKIFPYLRPLYDALYDMLEPDEVERMINKGMIEIAPLAYMRGRTLHNACIILDEAQNATREQMLMFLTRMGEDSACFITGDPSQTDLKPVRRSGLLEAREVLRHTEGVGFIEFESGDVVRHPVVQRIITAYERSRSQKVGWDEESGTVSSGD